MNLILVIEEGIIEIFTGEELQLNFSVEGVQAVFEVQVLGDGDVVQEVLGQARDVCEVGTISQRSGQEVVLVQGHGLSQFVLDGVHLFHDSGEFVICVYNRQWLSGWSGCSLIENVFG